MDTADSRESPYLQALRWIEYVGLDTGGGSRMAKLLLSLYNSEDYAFSAGECLSYMDSEGTALALRCLAQYAAEGESAALRTVGETLYPRCKGLTELGLAARAARQEVRSRWEAERRRQAALDYPEG